ncbi:TetR/AcrR family transcriptional regulator [Desulfosporosinus fructosivorans]|uniref:TetR/AcrR family transcriptional regulator n=1 Tax=Desulfosporosinus fructosivorans TaxID=2018669 RepID=UPI00130DF6A1|nr:TetR/AcrR family transcriptional regulator [Desulfosporosinus fructosivorans]
MRVRQKRERESRRESIIVATQQLLNEKTFESITMDDIALKSDFAKASIYQYFKNKDELMSEVFSKSLEMQCYLIEDKCISQRDPVQAMRNYILLEFDFIHLNPWMPKVSATIPFIGFNAENRLIELYNKKKILITSIIERGQIEGSFIVSDLVVLTNMILGVSAGFANYLATHISADLQSPVIEILVSTIIKGMTRGSSNESN